MVGTGIRGMMVEKMEEKEEKGMKSRIRQPRTRDDEASTLSWRTDEVTRSIPWQEIRAAAANHSGSTISDPSLRVCSPTAKVRD